MKPSLFAAALRPFGWDVFIDRDAPGRSPFDFARSASPGGADWEFWGLGLHVVVSRLQRA